MCPYEKKNAQALVELAVLGSFLIMLLGVLVSYGLRYINQQKTAHHAFREALALASEPNNGSASYTLISDKMIPDPSNPFALGTVVPAVASASITRNPDLSLTADSSSELPRMTIKINDQKLSYTTAGFRQESDVKENTLDKYKEIFGETIQGCKAIGEDGGCSGGWANLYDSEGELNTGEVQTDCEDDGEDAQINPETGEEVIGFCSKENRVISMIRFIDGAAGEIVDYESAVKQCRQIVDAAVCEKECNRGRTPEGEYDQSCGKICAIEMKAPNQSDPSDQGGAWYCADSDDKKEFPVLDDMFAFANGGPKTMGLQPGYFQKRIVNNQMIKEEGASSIKTTDTLDWSETINRDIVYMPKEHQKGHTAETETEDVDSILSEDKTETWQTDW